VLVEGLRTRLGQLPLAVVPMCRGMLRSFIRYLLPILLLALLLFGGWFWLQHYAQHGVLVRVPDLEGMGGEEAAMVLAKRDLEAVVVDSVYTDERPRGSVVDQDPDAGQEVKPGRKVYLVLNAMEPKMMDMPDLVNLSKRQAISVMEVVGLRLKELRYKPDPCTDCVLEQLYRGEPIAPDERIRRGEAITLVLGAGQSGERVPVPDLRGLTSAETRLVLNLASLNLGVVVACEGCNTEADSAFARVVRQSPAALANNMITLGGLVDIWLTVDTAGLQPVFNWTDTLEIPVDEFDDP